MLYFWCDYNITTQNKPQIFYLLETTHMSRSVYDYAYHCVYATLTLKIGRSRKTEE